MTEVHLPEAVAVVNVGLPMFGEAIRAQERPVQQVEWRVPADGDPVAVRALTALYGVHAGVVDAANKEVVRRLDEGVPQLVAMATVADVPGYAGRTLLHCGPPIDYADACDPLRRSMRAAAVAEGWAGDVDDAHAQLAAGTIGLDAANHHDMVVPVDRVVRLDGVRARFGNGQLDVVDAFVGQHSPSGRDRRHDQANECDELSASWDFELEHLIHDRSIS